MGGGGGKGVEEKMEGKGRGGKLEMGVALSRGI